MVVERPRNLNVRMSDEELAMLAKLAERDGLTSSDWLRLTIRRSYAEAFAPDSKPPPKRRKR
jgi:hypothetical protein